MRTVAKYSAVAAAAAAVLAVTATPVSAQQPASSVTVLDHGHVDAFGVAYEAGKLELHVHDEEADVEYAPSEVLLKANNEAKTTVPAGYDFLGAPGSKVWILPDTEVEGLLFAGWATEEVALGDLVGDSLQITVEEEYGRGDVALYTVDDFGGANVLFDSNDGAGTWDITAASHGHLNWGFTKSGLYQLSVEVEGVDAATGQAVSSGEVDYWFWVEA